MCVCVCVCVRACVYVYMAVDQDPCCRGPPPLLQTFVAGLLLQTLVADLCVEYCSLQGACRGGVCRKTPLSVTNLCREMAAQACYKANVFDSLPYMYKRIHICIRMYSYVFVCVHVYVHMCRCICVCIRKMCMYMYVYMYSYLYLHVRIYIYIYTYICI